MGDPLRILHVVVNMNRGGAETLIMNLYRNIDKEKVQFDFLTCRRGTFDAEITKMGGRVYQIPYITEVGPRAYAKEIEKFFTLNPAYKVIHSHLDKMSGLVLRTAKKANIPIRIAHSHNTESEGGALAKIFKWYAGNYVNRSATHLYACSYAAAKWLFGTNAKQAFILKNGVETKQFRFNDSIRERIRDSLNIHKDTFVIGHVGRFSEQKNHLFLLEVFASIHKRRPNTVLLLAGDGELREKIVDRIRSLQVQSHVRILGVRDDVPALLQAFDLFMFPSFHEGLPVTLIEAQAAGLPCVISDQITAEVDMGIERVKYLPITNQSIWVNHLLEIKQIPQSREVYENALAKKGYDIKQIAKQVEASYLSDQVGAI